MKKLIPIFLFFLCVLTSSKSFADININDLIQSKKQTINTITETGIEAKKEVEQAKLYKAEFDEAIKGRPSFEKTPDISLKFSTDFSNLNKPSDTQKDINNNFLLKDNRAQDVQEYTDKIESMKREKVASIFAQAFVTRTNIAVEKDEKKERKDTQDIIAATNAKLLSVANRQAQALALDNAYAEFINIDASQKQVANIEEGI